jgi:copper(I)-binding protein
MPRPLTLLILPILILSLVACIPDGKISVIDAWARPANQGDNSAVYFKINNPGPNTDSLIEARSEVAAQTELHESEMDSQGVMSMHHQNQIDIQPDSQLEFAPGGLHFMLIDLQQELKVGDTIKLTLRFKNYGELTLDVPIQQP